MPSKKLCPLLVIAYPHLAPSGTVNAADCMEKACAWYDQHLGECAVLSGVLAQSIEIARRERRER